MSISDHPVRPLRALAVAAEAFAGDLDRDSVLQHLLEIAHQTVGARYTALGVLNERGDALEEFLTLGVDDETVALIGPRPTGKGLLGHLIRMPTTLRLNDLGAHPSASGFPDGHPVMTGFLGTPVRAGGRVWGNLYLADKPGGFSDEDVDVIEVLAAQAGAAIQATVLSKQLRERAVLNERDRIGRDLHDSVIQALFSIGMSLDATRGLARDNADLVEQRLDQAVHSIDVAIRELRNTIFNLEPNDAALMGFSRGLQELAREYEVNALRRPELVVSPGIDDRLPPTLVPDLLQIVREGLSNAARHAPGSGVVVSVTASPAEIVLEITDDGPGFDPDGLPVGRGLDNIRERAELHNGTVTVGSESGRGTNLRIVLPT